MAARTPGQRAGLTRSEVVAAARRLLEDGGQEALTMRAVADRLDVAPNALYSHVPSKTALVDAVLDDVLADVSTEPAEGRSLASLHTLLHATLEVLWAHPHLVPLYVSRQGARGPNAQRLGEVMTQLLAGVGVAGPPAAHALRVLIIYTIGFAALGSHPPFEPERPLTSAELLESFDKGLRWLLAGIAELR